MRASVVPCLLFAYLHVCLVGGVFTKTLRRSWSRLQKRERAWSLYSSLEVVCDDQPAPATAVPSPSPTPVIWELVVEEAREDVPIVFCFFACSASQNVWMYACATAVLYGGGGCPSLFFPGGAVIDTRNRTAGININHAMRRAQFRFARTFKDGRFKVGLNPVVTYGPLRKRRINFSTLVPPYRPLLSESGLPRWA